MPKGGDKESWKCLPFTKIFLLQIFLFKGFILLQVGDEDGDEEIGPVEMGSCINNLAEGGRSFRDCLTLSPTIYEDSHG
jgi:hypothetical protein